MLKVNKIPESSVYFSFLHKIHLLIEERMLFMIKCVRPEIIPGTPFTIEFFTLEYAAPHFHPDSIEFLYCLSGEGSFSMDHEIGNISAGELITIEAENVHYIRAEKDNLFLSVHIHPPKTSYDWSRLRYYYFSCASDRCLPHQDAAMKRMIWMLLSLAYIYTAREDFDKRSFINAGEEILSLLIEHFCWFSVEELDSKENEKFKERLNNILTYMQKHYREKITLKELSQMEYVNESYFSRFLKRTTFHSFTLMLNYVRCFEGQRLLLNNDLPIHVISDECGFSSKKYFHRYFKHYWNTTPLQLRKRYNSLTAEKEEVSMIPAAQMNDFMKEYITDLFVTNAL